jgi:hypothetical protein
LAEKLWGIRMSDREPMSPKGRPHPSGAPIQRKAYGVTSRWRVPNDGYVIPRLQLGRGDTYAIGFTARVCAEDEAD